MKKASSQGKNESPIPEGTTLMESLPFAYCVKSSFIGELCDFCLKVNSNLRKCTGCLVVSYCGRNCQRQSWKDHKGECKNLAKVKPNIPPDSVRLISRIILKLQKGGDIEGENISPVWSRKFKDLMAHYKEVKVDKKRMEHFMTICAVLNEYLSDQILPNTAELLGIYGRVCVNSFNIVNGEMQSIGTGIYLAPSIIDHSCSPNAVVTFDGFKLRVQLTQQIPTIDWASIRISYIELMNSTHDRMLELKERYYFDCDCPRCHSDNIDKYHYASKCPSCQSAIIVKKNKGLFPPCTCGYNLSPSQSKEFWEAVEYSEQQLLLMHETNYLDVCKFCLGKQGKLFHDLCLVRSKILDAAFDSAIQLNLWEEAIQYGIPLIEGYKLWYGDRHPLTAILLLKLFKISLLVPQTDDLLPRKYYEEAVSIIEITHGRTSSFFKQEVKPLLDQMR